MNKWDEEFSAKITNLTDEIWTGSHSLKGLERIEGKIFAVIRKDRKHQRAEMLKRLPSEGQLFDLILTIKYPDGLPLLPDSTFDVDLMDVYPDEYKLATAIHKLVNDKVK